MAVTQSLRVVFFPPVVQFTPRGFRSWSDLQITHLGHLGIEKPFTLAPHSRWCTGRNVKRLLHVWRSDSRACISDEPSCQEGVLRDVFLCCSQWLEPSSLYRPLKGWQPKWMTYSCIAYRQEKHPARRGWCTGCTTRRLTSSQIQPEFKRKKKGIKETLVLNVRKCICDNELVPSKRPQTSLSW